MSGPASNFIIPVAGVLLAALALGACGVFFVGRHNALVVLRNRYKNAFAQLDALLDRHLDLLPDTPDLRRFSVAAQRAAANPGDPDSMGALSAAVAGLGETRGEEGLPEAIAVAFCAYNDAVADYNMRRRALFSFPVALVSGFGPSSPLAAPQQVFQS